MKRQTAYQPIGIGAAITIANRPDGFIKTKLNGRSEEGLEILRQKQLGRDTNVTIPSETTIIEM